jgi:phosphotriesterase-related protein
VTSVHTVSGPVDADDLGLTLVHEHLQFSSEGMRTQWPHLYDAEAEHAGAVREVRRAMEHGVKTICDPSCLDLGRDVRLLRRVADETGIQVVACTGIYGARYTFLPQHLFYREPDYLTDLFVHDIEVGIQGTDVKAAFLKCAVDEPGITDDVEKILRAVAKASLRTGRPIMAHTHPATKRGLEIMDLFDEEGVDPAKVQLAHTGDTDDLDHIEALLARGPFIGMDRYGLDIILPTEKRNATVIELCRRGHADRMMLSHDAAGAQDWFPTELKEQLAPNWHFAYLFETVLDQLREGGVDDEQIQTMLVANPARWLTA